MPRNPARIRQDHAWELRVSGMTFQEVADAGDPTHAAGYRALYASAGSARNAVLAAQVRHDGDVAVAAVSPDERRSLAHDRYELLIKAWMPKAVDGDELAAGIVARSLAGQAQLYGLNLRPASVPIGGGGGEDGVDEVARQRSDRRSRARNAGAAAAAPPD